MKRVNRTCMVRLRRAVALTATLCGLQTAFSAVPGLFPYESRVTDQNGDAVQGSHLFFVSLFAGGDAQTAGSGTLLFTETKTTTATDGTVNFLIGSDGIPGTISDDLLTTDATIFLQIALDQDTNVLLPRTKLESVPYAVRAQSSESATTATIVDIAQNANNLGGLGSSSFALAGHKHSSLAASDGNPDSALSVDAAGNVGIGTNSAPRALVDVNGTARVQNSLIFTGNTTFTQMVHDPGNASFRLGNEGEGIDQHSEDMNEQSLTTDANQTFVAGVDGLLTKIQVNRNGFAQQALLTLTEVASSAVLSTGTVGSVPASTTVIQTFTPSAPIFLHAGRQYRIALHVAGGKTGWEASFSNPYPAGQSSLGSGDDQWFRTYMSSGLAPLRIPDSGNTLRVDSELAVQGNVKVTTLTLGPATGDPPAQIVARTVPAGQGAANERSELILFNGNDPQNGFGPDTITLRAPKIRLQTFNNANVNDADTTLGSIDQLTIDPSGLVFVNSNLEVYGNGFKPGGGSWSTLSDSRLKKNVRTICGALDKVLALRGVTYKWKNPREYGGTSDTLMGLIANEVEKVFPQWVHRDAQGRRTLEICGFEALTVEALRQVNEQARQSAAEGQALESSIGEQLQQQGDEISRLREQLKSIRDRHARTVLPAASGAKP